jgi:hypothetical protein
MSGAELPMPERTLKHDATMQKTALAAKKDTLSVAIML